MNTSDVAFDPPAPSKAISPFVVHDASDARSLGVSALGRVLILAPHPDDESLGCGGLIARLVAEYLTVDIAIVTDGAHSHPNSTSFPPERLRMLRYQEALEAAQELGVTKEHVHCLAFEDCQLPGPHDDNFDHLVATFARRIALCDAQVLFVPYIRDPHSDHQSVHLAAHAVQKNSMPHLRILEYPIWRDEQARPDSERMRTEQIWSLDIRNVLSKKYAAIRCHRSQTTSLINDDPTGFRLTDEMIRMFLQSNEYYFEDVS